MKVCFEDVFECDTIFFHAIKIGLNLPQRIDNCRFSNRRNVISALGKTARIYLFNFRFLHCYHCKPKMTKKIKSIIIREINLSSGELGN